MPFGLKNTGITYQRAMNTIFYDLIGGYLECYIDDIVVKSQSMEAHLVHLVATFEKMKKFKLKLNPLICAFGVSTLNFLGQVVHKKGIQIDQYKAKAIIDAKPPSSKKEVQKFLGQVNFLRRFISNTAGKTKVFFSLLKLKNEEEFVWTTEHQAAFKGIKAYLAKHPLLMPPKSDKPLKLYIVAAEDSLGAFLAQDNEEGKEQAVYYLSRFLNSCECKNSTVEKLCLALYFAAMKLRYFLLPNVVLVFATTDMVKYMLSRPVVRGRNDKWILALSEFHLEYVPQ